MTRTTLTTSLLLFAAALGWVRYAPPLGRDSRTVQSILSPDSARRLRERTIPMACTVLGMALLVFGRRKREPKPAGGAMLTPPGAY